MKKKMLIVGLSLFALCFLIAPYADAGAGDFECELAKISTKDDGDVVVQVRPGVNETGFTDLARLYIDGTDSGANKILATILTAASLGYEITVSLDDTPTYNPIQKIKKAGLNM